MNAEALFVAFRDAVTRRVTDQVLRDNVWDLPPVLRVALARDILWDVLRNEGSAGGFTREQILEAWQALEQGPHPYALREEDRA